MKLIPYSVFKIDTEISSAEVLRRIEVCTGKKKFFDFNPSHEFNGRVDEKGFVVTKNITYRNSFLPVITGKVENKSNGAQVEISMRLHFFVICFMFFWLLFVSIGCAVVIWNFENISLFSAAIPFAMLIFAVALASGGFWFEAAKQRARLIELFQHSE